jgi:hypothetical protein
MVELPVLGRWVESRRSFNLIQVVTLNFHDASWKQGGMGRFSNARSQMNPSGLVDTAKAGACGTWWSIAAQDGPCGKSLSAVKNSQSLNYAHVDMTKRAAPRRPRSTMSKANGWECASAW